MFEIKFYTNASPSRPFSSVARRLWGLQLLSTLYLVGTEAQVKDTLDEVLSSLYNGLLHARCVGNWRVVHAQPLHRGVQQIKELLRYLGTDGSADAATLGRLIKDDKLVGSGEALSNSLHIQRLERTKLDKINVESFLLDGLDGNLCLLDAVEVCEDGNCLAGINTGLGCLVKESALVEGSTLVKVKLALGLLHHLHRREEEAGAVVTDHTLGDAVGSIRRGGRANLQSRDAHHVGVEGLTVLSTEGLVGGGTAGADDGHGHVELPTGGGVGVASGGNLGHAVNSEVRVHKLNDGTVSVHTLTQGLANEVSLIDNLVGAVVTDHTLGDAVGSIRRGGRANLQSRDAHHVGVEGLTVLSTEGLVGGGTAGADDGHGHVELPTGGGVGVASGGNLGHAVNSEVRVHKLNDGTVSVHTLTQGLANEVSLIDNLVSGTDLSVGLLSQLGDVVRRSSLQILGVDGGGGIAKHLLVDGKVDGIADGDLTGIGLGTEVSNVSIDRLHLLRADGAGIDLIRPLGRHLLVVVSVRGIGVLELLGKFNRRHGRAIGELDGLLHLGKDLLASILELVLAEDAVSDVLVLEGLDGVLRGTSPGFLLLASALVLGVGRRVTVETVGVDLKDGRSLATADVINDGLASLGNIGGIEAIDEESGDAVVLALLIDVAVLGNVLSEGVDGTAIVNHDNEKGEVVLGSGVEKLSHTSVLGATLTDEDNTEAIVVGGRGNILLLNLLVVGDAKVTVQLDTLGGTAGVRELLRNEGPATLEIGLLVEDVHRATGTLAGSTLLHEQLGHDGARIDATGDGVGVLPVVGVLLVTVLDGIVNEGGDGLLAIVQMHEASDLALHVLLVAGILKGPSLGHGVVDLQENTLIAVDRTFVGSNLLVAVPEGTLELHVPMR